MDRQHRDVSKRQIEVTGAVRSAVADPGLDRTLVGLVNLRVSQITAAPIASTCTSATPQPAAGTIPRLVVLPAWRDTTLFTAAERASSTLAESLTTLPDARTEIFDNGISTGKATL